MSGAYTPGLRVTRRTRHRVRRLLSIPGDVLVREGEYVAARQVVAQAFMPGDVTPLNMAQLLSIPPADVPECMLKHLGDHVEPGDALARTRGIFGRFRTEYKAQTAGTVESISPVTGQLMLRGAPIPIEIKAYLAGHVVEVVPQEGCVIEADVAFVQGIFGIGGEAFGPVRLACRAPSQELTPDLIRPDMKGGVVIGAARVTREALDKARGIGAAAVVTGGIDDADLEQFLGYTLGVAITGSEQVGLTLIITEGFGSIAMARRTFALLASHEGSDAAVTGATQIRAGVMRPEVLIPLTPSSDREMGIEHAPSGILAIGTAVRVIREPYFGQIGTVTALPTEPQTLESGSRARVLQVTFDAARRAVIPRANVELIEA
jgi:hypothetical protein